MKGLHAGRPFSEVFRKYTEYSTTSVIYSHDVFLGIENSSYLNAIFLTSSID